MPRIVLEYSLNTTDAIDFAQLFTDIHRTINTTGNVKITNCKSRAIGYKDYFIGSGGLTNAFVHLEVQWLEGRSPEVKSQLGEELLDLLKKYYQSTLTEFDLQITVHITDILRNSYFKYPEGTLTVL